MSAAFAFNTADTKTKSARRGFDITMIITMNRQTARVPAGACKLVELKIINDFIIKMLCKRIVFFDE
ncbi:hypothetical protein [Butyribacter sp.]|uniref:hypothetical protein n=1 Tax=Butyribacter sp. TaxID=2822465 RepID=UPI002A987129|nr:hypothetical protein [Butyribacter sp.]